MTGAVEVTQAQARAIKEGIKCYEAQGLRGEQLYLWFAFEHFRVRAGRTEPWEGLFAPLNDLTAYDFQSALRKGFKVKEDAE